LKKPAQYVELVQGSGSTQDVIAMIIGRKQISILTQMREVKHLGNPGKVIAGMPNGSFSTL
jgi:acetylglutamate synthase